MAINPDPKELYSVITSQLPNIGNYLKIVLKKENLSEEAEAKRQKYEIILNSLEQGIASSVRPCSIICDEDYFSANRRVADNSEQIKAPDIPGYLLWQDEKVRWRRGWCKAEHRDLRFYIYEDNSEECLLRSFSLENATTYLEGQVSDSGKDNCFSLRGVLYDAIGGNSGNQMDASTTPLDIFFAAYTELECKRWREILLSLLPNPESVQTLTAFDSNSWLAPILPQDSASSSSSNFSSNRDSVISNTSSLVNAYRAFSRSDLGEVRDHDDGKTLSVSKQQQPLPSPPHQLLIPHDDDAQLCDDEDNVSVGTIYESIDNLVLQFDDAIRNFGETMKPTSSNPMKPFKKKDRSIFRQHSFISTRNRSSKVSLLSEKRAEFEKGERYSSFMFKKNNSGSWKKKWCVLKGCIFGYYKSRSDSQGREFIILNGKVQSDIQDDRKGFVFSLQCTGVQEIYFSVDEEDTYCDWLSKLEAACASASDYAHALQTPLDESTSDTSAQIADSVYNVPRNLAFDPQLYDTPRGNSAISHSAAMTPDAAIDSGIYNVPRNLLMQPFDDAKSTSEDASYLLGGNPLDLYDYPRVSISPDEEGIYDDPLDIVDMEIYDYPPDASELGLDDFGVTISESSILAKPSEFTQSHIDSLAVPPLPSSARPSMNLSVGSISDEIQSPRNSCTSGDNVFDPTVCPANVPSTDGDNAGDNFLDSPAAEFSDPLLLEYGQCALKGYLYKKERFMTWIKMFCIIRNNFLECHKPHGDSFSPTLKLFLPGSEVKQGGADSKKKWAFQVKHPRREGILVFATDTEEDLHRWIKSFHCGTSIQVQPVSTVEEIRITDLDMQKRWTSLDKSIPPEEDSIPPRRKTFSAGAVPEEFSSDTLKRRRKFSWVKSNFMRRKNEKKILSGSQTDLNANRSSSRLSITSDQYRCPDPLRKSVSLELLPTATDSDESSHNIQSGTTDENFHGYLRVQRKGADNIWVRYWCVLEDFNISCYISQRDLTLTLSVQLQGSKIAESEFECQRKNSFKVLHVESKQCLYFAADNHEEFFRWFREITKCGHQVVSDHSDAIFGPCMHYYSIPKNASDVKMKRLSVVSEGSSSNFSEGKPSNTIFYRGDLLKSSHTGKWKQRYCIVNDGLLNIYHSSKETSPIISISLQGVSLELISTSRSSKNEYQFRLNPTNDGKSHTFAAPSETEMYAWISALRDASCNQLTSVGDKRSDVSTTSSPKLLGKSSKRKSKKLKDADLISYIPASSITNPDYCGYAEFQYGTEPWSKYWCVAFSNCLYVYHNKSSTSTIKTVVLPGYELNVGELNSAKYCYNLSLNHEGVSPVWIAVQTQEELDRWVAILETYTRAEGSGRQRKISGRMISDKATTHKAPSKVTSGVKKGPVKADHNISAVKVPVEEVNGSGESTPFKQGDTLQNYQDAIIRRYEKRIKKTHRVADQTEQKLKKQQNSLLHFKKELSRHVVKLQALSSSGDPHAQKRLKNIRTKLAQLDKIVPYLGKYITVNRQAEMQTIAVLKESCTVELQKLSQVKPIQKSKPIHETDSSKSSDFPDSTIPVPLPPSVLPSHELSCDENPYASLSEVRQEPSSTGIKFHSNYAELDFQKIRCSENMRPPSVKYSEVQIDALGIGRVPPPVVSPLTTTQSDESLIHDTTLTHENANLLVTADVANTSDLTTSQSENLSPFDHEVSPPSPPLRVDSITPGALLPTHEQPSPEVPSSQTSLGEPSVRERIKALQH